MGSASYSLSWIKSNLPSSFQPDYENEREELLRLREEVSYLEEELDLEKGNNRELQRQIIEGRKRSDEVCSMMCILRTETESVLNRHNMILDTPEARTKATELHQRALQEIEDEEDLEDDMDEFSVDVGLQGSGGEQQLTADADDELSGDEADMGGVMGTPDGDDGSEDYEDNDDDARCGQVLVKEVIVPRIGGTRADDSSGPPNDDISEGEEGEIDEDEEEEGEINEDEEAAAAGLKRAMGHQEAGIENTSKRRRV